MRIAAPELNPEQTYKLMSGIVVPRPIAWITTLGPAGKVNLAPFSCFTFVSNTPPMLGINIGRKAGRRKDTANNILEHGHFVVNIGNASLLDAIHASAEEHSPEVSEAEVLQLAVLPGESVATPRLAAAPVSLECTLHSVIPFGETGGGVLRRRGEAVPHPRRPGARRQDRHAGPRSGMPHRRAELRAAGPPW